MGGGIPGTVDQPALSRLFFLPWPFKERSSSSSTTPLPVLLSNFLYSLSVSQVLCMVSFLLPAPKLDSTNQRRPALTAPPDRNPDSNFIPFSPFSF